MWRKRPINFSDIVCILAALVGSYSALFAPWPCYQNGIISMPTNARMTREAGEFLTFLWRNMHGFSLIYWIGVIPLGFLLILLTLVSGRLRACLLPYLWLPVGLFGVLFPSVFFLLNYLVGNRYMMQPIFWLWGLPLTFVSYTAIFLAAVYSISRADIVRVRCPYCAELIMPDAKICRFCDGELQD